MLNRQDMEEILSRLSEINAPFVQGDISTLGGQVPSLHILISMQPREDWTNGILENSDYGHFWYHTGNGWKSYPGKLHSENNRIGKFRKCEPKSVQDFLDRLNKFLSTNKEVKEYYNIVSSNNIF